MVILDIAVPRDFDPRIHDGDQHLSVQHRRPEAIREATLADRREHVGPAEAIVEQEAQRFLKDWGRRRQRPGDRAADARVRGEAQEVVCATCSPGSTAG